MMRDEIKKADRVFVYHANYVEHTSVGIMEIVKEDYVDHTAFEPTQKYYAPKSDPAKPCRHMVSVRYKRKPKRPITLG